MTARGAAALLRRTSSSSRTEIPIDAKDRKRRLLTCLGMRDFDPEWICWHPFAHPSTEIVSSPFDSRIRSNQFKLCNSTTFVMHEPEANWICNYFHVHGIVAYAWWSIANKFRIGATTIKRSRVWQVSLHSDRDANRLPFGGPILRLWQKKKKKTKKKTQICNVGWLLSEILLVCDIPTEPPALLLTNDVLRWLGIRQPWTYTGILLQRFGTASLIASEKYACSRWNFKFMAEFGFANSFWLFYLNWLIHFVSLSPEILGRDTQLNARSAFCNPLFLWAFQFKLSKKWSAAKYYSTCLSLSKREV